MRRAHYLAVTLLLLSVASAAQAAESRSFTSGRYALVINGQFAGFVAHAEGGHVSGKVVERASGAATSKSLSGVRIEPLRVKVGIDGKTLWTWIGASLAGSAKPADVMLVTYDSNLKQIGARALLGSMLTGLTIPALAGSSKSSLYVTLEITPTRISYEGGKAPAPTTGTIQKALRSNFRLKMSGVPTGRLSQIGELTWSRKAKVTSGRLELGAARVTDLNLQFSAADKPGWQTWFQAMVLSGKQTERTATLEFLSADLAKVLRAITLRGVGIHSLGDAPIGSDQVARSEVGLYVESLRVTAP